MYGGEETCIQVFFLGGGLRERGRLKDEGVDGRIILRWIFRKSDGGWTGLIWLRIGADGGLFKCGNEPSVCTKCGECLD